MNNQAAQTMPELPGPFQKAVIANRINTMAVRQGYEAGGYEKSPDLYTADQMHQYARDYAASQTAGVADVKDRKDAERYRWLRDTQTSYGISAQYDDAGSPLIWLRFSGYGSNGEGTDAAIDRAMLAAAPAASDGEDEMCPNCVTPWKCNGPHESPAGASVGELARELLVAEYKRDGIYCNHFFDGAPLLDQNEQRALRAIEQALTQQRGEPNGKLVGWWNGIMPDVTERSPYGPSVRWGADAEDSAHDIPLYDGYNPIHYTTPQPSADAVREGYYLASFKRSHDRGYVTWWMADNAGYTSDLNQAGIYTELTPGYHDSEYTVPVPVSFIDRLRVRRMVDVGDSDNRALWTANDLRAALANELESLLSAASGEGVSGG